VAPRAPGVPRTSAVSKIQTHAYATEYYLMKSWLCTLHHCHPATQQNFNHQERDKITSNNF
jgi:hypothetical protein